jgi:hypothetical protein
MRECQAQEALADDYLLDRIQSFLTSLSWCAPERSSAPAAGCPKGVSLHASGVPEVHCPGDVMLPASVFNLQRNT